MNNTIQLYVDKKQEIKGYPITSPDRVIDENGVNINERLDSIVSQLSNDLATKDYVEDAINSAKLEGGDVPIDLTVYARKTDLHDHSNKTILDSITTSKVNQWDNKSNFSGNYNDLTNKPTIPTKVSELTNDKGYLTQHQDISGKVDKVNGYSLVSNAEINRLATLKNYDDGEIRELISTIAPPNIIYMDSYGELTDYSAKLQELVNNSNNVEIRFSNKEYVFKSKVTISKKVRLIGSNSSFVWKGEGRFLEYVNAPWMIEGCVIKDIIFTGRGQDVGQDMMIYSEVPNVMMTIENCQFYNCYCFLRFHTQSYGHLIKDCSFWGFTTAINCTGNAEQITLDHCWLDDGLRTEGSQNPVIRVEDATSFWITRCVIQNADIGVSFKGVRNGTIRDCHFENMINSSIWLNSNAQYENRNCVIDCNYLVGGKCAIYFYLGSQKNVHNTICNNYIGFLGTNSSYAIQGSQNNACEYTAFYNNSIAPEYTNRPLLSNNVGTNKIQNFQ